MQEGNKFLKKKGEKKKKSDKIIRRKKLKNLKDQIRKLESPEKFSLLTFEASKQTYQR